MTKVVGSVAAVLSLLLLGGCAPLYPSAPAAPDARKFYVGGYVKQGGVLVSGRIDVTISAIGGKADPNPDPGRPGAGGFGGIPDGPVSSPWERHFAIERNYDKTVTVELTLTYIAPAFVVDELTCYIADASIEPGPTLTHDSPHVLDTLTVRSRTNRSGSEVMIAHCLTAIPPLTT